MATKKKAAAEVVEPEVIEEEVPKGLQVPESVEQVLATEDLVDAALADPAVPDIIRTAVSNVKGAFKHLHSTVWQVKALYREDLDA